MKILFYTLFFAALYYAWRVYVELQYKYTVKLAMGRSDEPYFYYRNREGDICCVK